MYDIVKESIVDILPEKNEQYSEEYVKDLIQEISLSTMLAGLSKKTLGNLWCIITVYDNLSIISFQIKDAILILAIQKDNHVIRREIFQEIINKLKEI